MRQTQAKTLRRVALVLKDKLRMHTPTRAIYQNLKRAFNGIPRPEREKYLEDAKKRLNMGSNTWITIDE